MTNNTLKSTIDSIRATNALIVVTLAGTFNSQTGASILPGRVTVEARNKFLSEFCDRASATESKDALDDLSKQLETSINNAYNALEGKSYAASAKYAQEAADIEATMNEPRFYYKLKQNLDLRTVAEKRAEKKAQKAVAKGAKAADKAAKMTQKVEGDRQPGTPATPAAQQPLAVAPSSKKTTTKAAA